jgi:hypothetical protein
MKIQYDVNVTPWSVYPRETNPVPMVQKARSGQVSKISPPLEVNRSDCANPAHIQKTDGTKIVLIKTANTKCTITLICCEC